VLLCLPKSGDINNADMSVSKSKQWGLEACRRPEVHSLFYFEDLLQQGPDAVERLLTKIIL